MLGLRVRLVCLLVYVFVVQDVGCAVQTPEHVDFLDRAADCFNGSVDFLTENVELIQLVQALAHLPYVFTVDSVDPSTLRVCSMISASSTGVKVAYELARKREERLGKMLVLDVPKVCLFLLSMGYDVIRFLDAVKVAYKNKTDVNQLRVFKINQCAHLSIEVFLRMIAWLSRDQEKSIAGLASELADWISIWRLINRYTTYFRYTKQLEISIKFQTQEEQSSDKLDSLDEKELAGLASLAASVLKQSERETVAHAA